MSWILLTRSAWLYTMELLVLSGWDGVKCKYWCQPVGLIYKSVITSALCKWTSKLKIGTQLTLKIYVNLVGWWLFKCSTNFGSSFSRNIHINTSSHVIIIHHHQYTWTIPEVFHFAKWGNCFQICRFTYDRIFFLTLFLKFTVSLYH